MGTLACNSSLNIAYLLNMQVMPEGTGPMMIDFLKEHPINGCNLYIDD